MGWIDIWTNNKNCYFNLVQQNNEYNIEIGNHLKICRKVDKRKYGKWKHNAGAADIGIV